MAAFTNPDASHTLSNKNTASRKAAVNLTFSYLISKLIANHFVKMSRDLFSFNLAVLCFLASLCCKELIMVVGQIVQKPKKNELDLCNLAFSFSFKLLYLG